MVSLSAHGNTFKDAAALRRDVPESQQKWRPKSSEPSQEAWAWRRSWTRPGFPLTFAWHRDSSRQGSLVQHRDPSAAQGNEALVGEVSEDQARGLTSKPVARGTVHVASAQRERPYLRV